MDKAEAAEAVLPAQGGTQVGTPQEPAEGTGGGRRRLDARFDPWLLSAVFFVLYAALSVTRYRRMLTMSWDLGIFEEAIKGYAHLHAPIADLKGPGFNELGDHFSPITALVSPFYRVFPSPVTLLVAQAVLFALSAVPITRVAAWALGRRRGLMVGVAYGLSWGVQRAVDFDFHEVAFAMPLLAFALEALIRRRWHTAMWWSLPLVLVKEDLGASVALIGLVVLLRAREDDEGTGPRTSAYAIALMAFGVLSSALEIKVLIPHFYGPGYDAFNHINGDGALTGHIPVDTAIRTLLWILVPAGGLLALRSPLMLVALPTIGWRFISHYPENWGTAWHYSAVLMPVVFLAFVDAAFGLTGKGAAKDAGDAGRSRRNLVAYAAALPAAMAGAALALSTQLPVATLTHTDTYKVNAHTKAVEKLLDQIPSGSTVEANVGPISRLVHRTTVYWVGGSKGVVPDYMALDNGSGWVQDPVGYASQLHPQAHFAVIASAEGYVILHRTS
ncbi:DUF2079 domain-containing protein [Streptomyces sp. NPDC051976]|uniref:DUF2079 domain-containing protein n=1 Tax=Streptomyces sp. NPDC051976 TaxID=3154947 RepID=UPI00341926C0